MYVCQYKYYSFTALKRGEILARVRFRLRRLGFHKYYQTKVYSPYFPQITEMPHYQSFKHSRGKGRISDLGHGEARHRDSARDVVGVKIDRHIGCAGNFAQLIWRHANLVLGMP